MKPKMKVVILAGGFGTRISEESHQKPKPMIEIGGKPILWHIMKIYSNYGFNDFIVCLGYKANKIREYFSDYFNNHSDFTLDFTNNSEKIVHKSNVEPWRITLVDTGKETMTGGRVKRIQKYIGNNPFLLTYGDGVSDVNIENLVEIHNKHKKIATLTAIQPSGRFGSLKISENGIITGFKEKVKGDGGWINGGFFVCEPEIFNYIDGDETIFEEKPLQNLSKVGQLVAYKHEGFWHCMDTLKEKMELEALWNSGNPPWKLGDWND